MTVIDELGSLPARIRASVERIGELREQASKELQIRDGLIVQAIDHAKMTQAAVARAAGVSQAHIVRILANNGVDDD